MRLKTVITLLLFLLADGFLNGSVLNFKHLTVDDGLLYNIVESAIEDEYGIMWFSTSAGVCSYNGFEFKFYKNDPSDSMSLSYNLTGSMLESTEGDLYICTRGGGLNIYNRETDDFKIYKSGYKKGTLSNNDCESIIQDSEGNIWIGTHHGLDLFNAESGTFVNFMPVDEYGEEIKISVQTIYEDDKKNLWIGTISSGLYKFNLESRVFQLCKPVSIGGAPSKILRISDIEGYSGNQLLIASGDGLFIYNKSNNRLEFFSGMGLPEKTVRNFFHVILKDTDGRLWIGSDIGLFILNAYENDYDFFQYESDNPNSLTSNDIRDLYEDSNGNIWICTRNGGVNMFNRNFNSFHYLSFTNSDKYLMMNNINCFCSGGDNILWIGTTGGLIKYNYLSNDYNIYNYKPGVDNSIGENNIMATLEDSRGNIWIGGKRDGITIFHVQSGQFRKFIIENADDSQLDINEIIDIHEDYRKIIWIATSGGGLIKYNPANAEYKQYIADIKDTNSLSNSWLTGLYEDNDSNLWVATTFGVNLYNREKDHFKQFFSEEDTNSLSINHVRTIYQDSEGVYWFGTYGGGLNRFDMATNTFTLYNEKNGLSGDMVQGILEDEYGYLWVSTNNGITRLNTKNGQCEQFDIMDGLQGNNFNSNACIKTSDGTLYFGGNNGITYFKPGDIQKNQKPPEVYISNLKIFNENSGINSADGQPFLPEMIELNYKQSFLTFEFFAIDFNKPLKTKYSFILEGLEENWNTTDASNREITYSNVPPGNYVFKVIASNGDGIWNKEGDNLMITITPPFWKSQIAYATYFLLIIVVLIGIRRYILLKERERNARKLEKLEHEKIHEIDQFKLKLYTNIYHDLRTPLTLIIGPLNELITMQEVASHTQVSKYLGIMKKNTSRLLRLLSQLMEVRKIETGKYKLEIVRGDLDAFVKEVYQSFEPSMHEKQINHVFESHLEKKSAFFDPKIVETVLTNLLSNAIKFTPENGNIQLKLNWFGPQTGDSGLKGTAVKLRNGFFEITVRDDGAGISEKDIPHIFERFYRASGIKNTSTGSGIGLSLTKDFIELHHGTIKMHSIEGKGSVFTVRIPSDPDVYGVSGVETHEFSIEEYLENRKDVPLTDNGFEASHKPPKPMQSEATEKPKVLIVEDDSELRQYISEYLSGDYNILEAENGQIAFDNAVKDNPNLIVSDIIMPEMDGFTLCKKIKTTEETSHIPVLLLTSLSDSTNKLEGLEIGADEYVTKPFDIKMLATRIHNLIVTRSMLKKKFSSEITLSPKDITITPIDEVFLNKTMEVIESNMSESEFTVDDLVREVGVSRSLFYLKIKELTGQAAKEFIKSMRLKRAAQYIVSNQFNVSEVAFMVGFKDPKYFSKCFEKQFGELPKNYKTKASQTNPAS